MKVIMLSSQGSASGTNLTKATQVILLDPVYGDYTTRKNTEGQAIARSYRIGQEHPVTVIRFIIKDSIEEKIYSQNMADDLANPDKNKHKYTKTDEIYVK